MTVVRIVPKFVAPGPSEFQGSFWMDVQPTPDLADLTELLTNWTDWLQDMYDTVAPIVQTTITAIEYAVYIHDLVTGIETHFADGGWTFAGTNPNKNMAPQVSATVSAKVVGRKRPAQKRMIPYNEGVADDGIFNVTGVANSLAFGAQWIGARPASTNYTYEPGLVSVGAPGQFNGFSGIVTANTAAGTVQSRKRGNGI